MPLRSDALPRDGASLRVQTGYVSEVGIAHLGLSNAAPWEQAWQPTQTHLLALRGVADCWVHDVATFASPHGPKTGQGVGSHVQSGGVIVDASLRVTIANTHIGRAENRGTGGNGYRHPPHAAHQPHAGLSTGRPGGGRHRDVCGRELAAG